MIELQIANLYTDGGRAISEHEILLRIVAQFSIWQDGCKIYSEVDFPVVELACQLFQWLERAPRAAFQFDSMESDVLGLIWFRPDGPGEWRVGSAHTRVCSAALAEGELLSASRRFVEEVIGKCRQCLGIEVAEVVKREAKR